MRGVSWHARLPGGFIGPSFDELRLLTLTHHDFAGAQQNGELVVAARVANDVLGVFAEIYEARFPIAKMVLVEEYGADDERSMAANNSSAFNCRLIAGTNRPSSHALGLAIDINPVQNPYIVRGEVHPPEGRNYIDRDDRRPGMLHPDDPVVAAFARRGFRWGGSWNEPQDYHHFECVVSAERDNGKGNAVGVSSGEGPSFSDISGIATQ
jgi:poly-gamma-glutamate synthesis protein (capsule biosynthesis protein)